MFNFGVPRQRNHDNKLYHVLGVNKDADQDQIKKAYRKLAKQYHPDKGGNKKKFEEVTESYEILGDVEKRKMYDRFGITGTDSGASVPAPGGGIFDMFRPKTKTTTEDIVFPLVVSLDALYEGTKRKIRVTTKQLCVTCGGHGGTGQSIHCISCQGQGKRVQMKTLAPGMFQKLIVSCNDCKGKGKQTTKKCTECEGKGTQKQQKTIHILVQKGTRHGHKLTYSGESDQEVDKQPGDVVVIIQELDHDRFKRKDNHLFFEQRLTIKEALCGFTRTIKFFKGKNLLISRKQEVTAHGELVMVKNYGMPVFEEPFRHGNLYIRFIVDFPESLTPHQHKLLEQAFSSVNPAEFTDDEHTERIQMVKQDSEPKITEENESSGPECRTQ